MQALLSILLSIKARLKGKTADGEDCKSSCKAKEGKALISDFLAKLEEHRVTI